MRKIRVLRVITWLPVGGIERKIVEVLPRLDRSRFEVRLVCLRERGPLADELEQRGIPVDLIPFRSRWDLGALRSVAALMREREIDIVHSHMYRSNVPATVAARFAGVRHVWTQIHNVGTWETRRQAVVDRSLCRWRDGVIAVSEKVRREAIEVLRLPEEKVRLIYNGVDLRRFGTGTLRDATRREAGVKPGDLVFAMVARIVEQKRPQDFLDLAAALMQLEKDRPGTPALRFWLIGDGPMIEELKSKGRSLPFPDRVRFVGRVADVGRWMDAADVFIMPSAKEGFSNALLEAMASGLAVIATDVGGNAEAVRNQTDGLIVPPFRPGILRAAAEGLILDSAKRETLRAAARERAQAFSLEAMIRNVENLYESSLSLGGP